MNNIVCNTVSMEVYRFLDVIHQEYFSIVMQLLLCSTIDTLINIFRVIVRTGEIQFNYLSYDNYNMSFSLLLDDKLFFSNFLVTDFLYTSFQLTSTILISFSVLFVRFSTFIPTINSHKRYLL